MKKYLCLAFYLLLCATFVSAGALPDSIGVLSQEVDGSPSGYISKIIWPNGTLTISSGVGTIDLSALGGGDMSASVWDSNSDGFIDIAKGGTGSTNAVNARSNLGLAINTDVLAPTGSAASLTDFPTFNQDTTGMAGSLKSPATTGKITVTGPLAGTTRVKTVRDADETLLELGGSYTPSGTWNWGTATVTWPTFNQATSSTAANLSGTPALPNGTTATTQAQADNSTKIATDKYVDIGLATKSPTAGSSSLTTTGTIGTGVWNATAIAGAKVDIHGTTVETTAADTMELLIYDADAAANRRITRGNFVAGLGGGASPFLDLADDGSNESAAITEIATVNDNAGAAAIFTEPANNKLLINVSKLWPTAAVANSGDSATAFFSAGVLETTIGGTGLATIAAGSILAANTADTLSAITSASGLKLLQNNAGTVSWATVTGTGSPVLGTAPAFTTSIAPAVAGASTIGTTALEWGNVYLTDSAVIYAQANQGNSLTSSATGWTANLDITAPAFVPNTAADSAGEIGYTTNAFSFFANSENMIWTAGTNTWTYSSSTGANLVLGSPTVTTLNGHTFTAGSSTFTGTAGQTYTFPAASATLATLGANTITGVQTLTPAARTTAAAVSPYWQITTPADTDITASTAAPGMSMVTSSRQWAPGTVAVQAERVFNGPTYTGSGATATFTDVFNTELTPPIVGANAAFTRGHTLGILDATSATSSITGGLVVATAFGTAATSVGIGGGKIEAGGSIKAGGLGTFAQLNSGASGFTSDADGDTVVKTLNGHTFTAGSSTFTGTAGQTYTFPSATSTLMATTGSPAAMVIASQAAGDMWVASSGSAMARLAAGATTDILVGGGAAAPVWTAATGTGAPARAGSPTFTTKITTPLIDLGAGISITGGAGVVTFTDLAGTSEVLALDLRTANTAKLTTTSGVATLDIGALKLVTTGTLQAGMIVNSDANGMTGAEMEAVGVRGTLFIATGAGTWILPEVDAAHVGSSLCLVDSGTNHDLILDVHANDDIQLKGTEQANGVGITNAATTTTGDFVCVVAISAGHWITLGMSGVWASQ